MTSVLDFSGGYIELLRHYALAPSEAVLMQVQDLAWNLLAQGVPLEDIGELHETSLRKILADQPGLNFAAACDLSPALMELLVVYGMGLRERAEENARQELLAQHNQQLEILLGELERSNKDLEEFAYVTSHDLQAPLRHIRDYLSLLSRDTDSHLSPRARDFMKRSTSESDRMQEMIRGILGYARIGPSGAESIDLSAIAKETIESLKADLDSCQGRVLLEKLPTVSGQPIRIAQLLRNLLENAIKYRGDDALTVRISAHDLATQWRIDVSDNGIGMNPQLAPSVFKLFSRLNTRPHVPGTGIGLSHCRRIVEAHGGQLTVRTALGSGSTFSFTLPKYKSDSGKPPSPEGIRILVIDDDEDDRALLRATLESSATPMEVLESADGPTGVSLYNSSQFDCVLVDYGLPGMEGPEILRALQAVRPSAVVAMSGDPGQGWANEMASLGAAVIFSKHDMLAAGALEAAIVQAMNQINPHIEAHTVPAQ